MKKLFTLLSTTFLSVTLFAFAPQTKLTITAKGKSDMTILVDGRNYNNSFTNNSLVINNPAVGAHNIKVYQQSNTGWFNKKATLLYDGNVYVKPQSQTSVVINKAGKAVISEDRFGDNDYPSNNDNGGWNARYPQAMNDRGFDQFRFTVNKTSFENPKMQVAKEVISQNYFTTAQVKTLLESFNYETSKLEMAKYAYDRTLDKENFYDVMNVFSYSSSKEELARFLQRSR